MSEFEQVLLDIIKNLKSTCGRDFFNELARQLDKIIEADYTFIAQVDIDKYCANTLSLIAKGQLADNFEYHLEHTPCAVVIDDSICYYPKNICALFPRDKLLVDMNIEGYIGVALYDSNGKVNGLVVALYQEEITNGNYAKTLFELFSGRIAAEIERYEQKKDLEQLNSELASKIDALMKSEAKLANHLQNTPLGCITWDKNFTCTEWNKAAEKIFGYSASQAVGCHASKLVVPSEIREEINEIFQCLLEQKGGFQNTNENITKTGDIIKCDWYNTPIVSEDGMVIGVSSLIHDITEKEQQEQLLVRSQKMDALGKLTGGMAHDQNNMLGVILGYSELLSIKLNDQPQLFNYAKQIQRAAQRGAQRIGKLLSLSRTSALTEAKTDINSVLLAQQDMLQKTLTAQICLELTLTRQCWPIWLDQHDLEDAIFNLCINSMDAMKNNTHQSKLAITTENIKLDVLVAHSLGITEGDYIKLCITDNGTGMNEKMKAKIFDPFFSTKGEKGTGLGLSQVFSFVQRSKGNIEVKTKVGEGTSFILYFPRHKTPMNKTVKTAVIEDTELQGHESILIVDDEQALCDLCAELLTIQGYQVYGANGYKKALELLDCTSIDLMISDVIMPEMNGYQLSSIVKEKYPSVKIQLVSGFADTKEIESISHIDKTLQKDLLNKPYDSQALYRKVRHLLDN